MNLKKLTKVFLSLAIVTRSLAREICMLISLVILSNCVTKEVTTSETLGSIVGVVFTWPVAWFGEGWFSGGLFGGGWTCNASTKFRLTSNDW